MQAFKQAFPTLTKEAYFDYCDRHEGKYEFHDGMVIAMAGGTTTHTRLGGMAYRLLSDSVEENDCEAFVFEKSVAVEFDENYYYPDVVVVCGEAKYDDRKNLLNPVLIVEVLSRSTAFYDRNTKFERYRSIPTVHFMIAIPSSSVIAQSRQFTITCLSPKIRRISKCSFVPKIPKCRNGKQ